MKEDIKTKDGKRKLYFTIDMLNFIPYNLEKNTTCAVIFETNKNSIITKLNILNKNSKIDLDNYDFFLVDLKGIKKGEGNPLTKIRINRNLYISNILQNPKTILCFLQKNKINKDLKIKSRNKILDNKSNILSNEKLLEIRNNYLNNKQIEDFYTNKTIFLYNYDNHTYTKLKANLSEKKLTIHGKIEKNILIQDILSNTYCDLNNPLVNSLYITSGFKPPYYIIIKTNDEQIIIGLKNDKKWKKWMEGMDSVIANYKNFINDIDLKINTNNLKKDISENEKNIIEDALIYENLLKNKEKKKIFYSLFEDKKLAKLIEDIFIYKSLIESNNFNKGIVKLYEILDMINKNNKEETQLSNISTIINKERLFKYADIYNKANDLIKLKNLDGLKIILKRDLFDDSLIDLNKLYIIPNLNKYKEEFEKISQTNNKSEIRKNIQSLIGYYFMKFYQLNEKNSFLELNEQKY